MIRRILNGVGRVLFGSGVVVLLFTAYQLWGTGILESHSQQSLRTSIDHALPNGAAERGDKVAHQVAAHPITVPPTTGPLRLAPVIAPPAPGTALGILQIPSIGVDQVVVEGVGEADLRLGPGHYPGTPLPGESGNVSIAGHRTTYGHPFYNLNSLTTGGQIIITTSQGVFVYSALSEQVISPSDNSVLDPSTQPILTLTTCNPRYSAAQRLVVKAQLVQSQLFGPNGHSKGKSHPTSTTTTAPRNPKSPTKHTAVSNDLAGQGESNDYLPAVLWALGTLLCGFVVWLVARRSRRKWLVYLPGALVVLAALFGFFVAVSPLLPASF